MYTGITRGTRRIVAVQPRAHGLRYEVDFGPELASGLEPGASVSIDGVCQTVVGIDSDRVAIDAIRESLERTTLDRLAVGRAVAVERSARAGDEIGGHEVWGHVAGTGVVCAVTTDPARRSLRIEGPAVWRPALLEKGFVAVDGSSLTVCDLEIDQERCRFTVNLIPETIRLTNLGDKRVGDRVNVELDARTMAIVETVERVLHERGLGTLRA
jgi:riboflavin synthase